MAKVFGVQEIYEYIRKKANDAAERAKEQLNQGLEQKVKRLTDEAVQTWYGGYGPEYYGRSGNLKDYNLVSDGDGVYVDFDQQIASHQDNDLVTEIVVAVGYHGGSPGTGTDTISWRTGPNFCKWGRPATHSPAIINEVNEGIDKINSESMDLASQLFSKYFSL